MKLTRLKVFAAVAENKGFSKAAKELFISQPAVSIHINKLEKELGVLLIKRSDKNVELTPAGMVLYKYARRIIDLMAEAETEINKINGVIEGRLTIGATLTIGEYILPQIIGSFKQLHPRVEILLHVQNTEVIVEKLLSGHYDLALIEGLCDNHKIHKTKYLDDEIVLIVSRDHPWSKKGIVSLEEVSTCDLILREPGSGTRKITELALRDAGLDIQNLNILMELGSSEAIKGAVAANLGAAFISRWTLEKELKMGLLSIIEIEGFRIPRSFNFIYSMNGICSPLQPKNLSSTTKIRQKLLQKKAAFI